MEGEGIFIDNFLGNFTQLCSGWSLSVAFADHIINNDTNHETSFVCRYPSLCRECIHGTEYVAQDDEEPAVSGGVSLGDRGRDIGPQLVTGVAACESMDNIHTHKLTTP